MVRLWNLAATIPRKVPLTNQNNIPTRPNWRLFGHALAIITFMDLCPDRIE